MQQILPHEPDDYFRHAHHSKEFSRGQEKPDPNSSFETVANALRASGPSRILIFGTGRSRTRGPRCMPGGPRLPAIEGAIFFRKDISGITDLASLKGFPVAAKLGDHAADLLAASGGATVQLFPSYEAMIAAAARRKANVFVMDAPPAAYFLNKSGLVADFRRSAPVYVGQFHRAVRKGDAALLRTITDGFAAIGPDELKRIDEKWLGRPVGGGRYLGYAGYGAGVALMLLGGLFGWNRLLKNLIARRTATLRQNEQQFRQLAENIHEVFWLIDVVRQTLLYVSPNYEIVWGRSSAFLYSAPNPWPDSVHPDDLERMRRVVTTSKATGTYVEVFRIVRPDGSIRWIREQAFPVHDAAGVVYRMAGIAEDITERKQADEELRCSEERFRTSAMFTDDVLNSLTAHVVVLDERGVIIAVNEAWRRFAERSGAGPVDFVGDNYLTSSTGWARRCWWGC